MDLVIGETTSRMQKVLDVIKADIATVRTGRATPSLVENVIVNAYGGAAKLKIMELATVGASDPQTLVITPFDATTLGEINKAIQEANIGYSPVVDSSVIRISIPPLSLERRQELIHLMHQKLENGRILIRQARQDGMNEIKKDDELSEDEQKRLEKEIQRVTDEFMGNVDSLGKQKEEELLQL
ncbi:MAG TPA: ribosome recycling factor [Patescibacteria group bacterium]|nr:ribosome recycling factor [Patescibacteria group bacterium]